MQDNIENATKQKITTGQEIATSEYIDGKQVFRKRINVGNLPNTGNFSAEHNLGNVRVIKYEGFAYRESTKTIIPMPYANSVYYIEMYLDATKLYIDTSNDRSQFVGCVDIYYTKN